MQAVPAVIPIGAADALTSFSLTTTLLPARISSSPVVLGIGASIVTLPWVEMRVSLLVVAMVTHGFNWSAMKSSVCSVVGATLSVPMSNVNPVVGAVPVVKLPPELTVIGAVPVMIFLLPEPFVPPLEKMTEPLVAVRLTSPLLVTIVSLTLMLLPAVIVTAPPATGVNPDAAS